MLVTYTKEFDEATKDFVQVRWEWDIAENDGASAAREAIDSQLMEAFKLQQEVTDPV